MRGFAPPSTLGIIEDQQRRSEDTRALFAVLCAAAEGIDVYVLLLGDIGSDPPGALLACFPPEQSSLPIGLDSPGN